MIVLSHLALYGFDAINITFGLPYIRMSQDHGIAEDKIKLNTSNPLSLNRFIDTMDRMIKWNSKNLLAKIF